MTTVGMLSVLFGFTIFAGLALMIFDQMGLWKHVPGVRSRAERRADDARK